MITRIKKALQSMVTTTLNGLALIWEKLPFSRKQEAMNEQSVRDSRLEALITDCYKDSNPFTTVYVYYYKEHNSLHTSIVEPAYMEKLSPHSEWIGIL